MTGQEIFGAHYDNGRNTLSVDQDPVWDHLSKMAVAKYKDIEAKSGKSKKMKYYTTMILHVNTDI